MHLYGKLQMSRSSGATVLPGQADIQTLLFIDKMRPSSQTIYFISKSNIILFTVNSINYWMTYTILIINLIRIIADQQRKWRQSTDNRQIMFVYCTITTSQSTCHCLSLHLSAILFKMTFEDCIQANSGKFPAVYALCWALWLGNSSSTDMGACLHRFQCCYVTSTIRVTPPRITSLRCIHTVNLQISWLLSSFIRIDLYNWIDCK